MTTVYNNPKEIRPLVGQRVILGLPNGTEIEALYTGMFWQWDNKYNEAPYFANKPENKNIGWREKK